MVLNTVSTLFTVFGARGQRQLQALHLLVRDRVETLRTERRNQMPLQNRFRCGDPARFVTVGTRVAVDESRRELCKRGYLLFHCGWTVL
jgi:hypothetical protein